ncbi:unnamed protein product [Effrenium voratum]|nr:unnamed protein product [Effrenium voratum]
MASLRCAGLARRLPLPQLRLAASVPEPSELEQRAPRPTGWWSRFVQFSYHWLGDSLYHKKADICNCGGDFGVTLPRSELLQRAGIEKGTYEHRMQLYGGALYWHMATNITERFKDAQPSMLRDKDVLEVACMRGGGARYLAEVAQPRWYLAVDHVQSHIDRCRENFGEWPGLEFEVMDAHDLARKLPAESFDYVLCIQAAASFEHVAEFVAGTHHVLRKGGRLLLADALQRNRNAQLLDALEARPYS